LPCRERLGDRWRSHVGWIKRAGAETRRMMVVGFWAGCDGGDRFRCRNEEWLGRVVTRSARGRGGGRSRERSRQEKEAPAGQGGGRRLRRRVGFVCGLLRIGWCWFVPDRRPCSVGWNLGADHGARAVAGAGFLLLRSSLIAMDVRADASRRPGRRAVGWLAGAPAGSRAVGGKGGGSCMVICTSTRGRVSSGGAPVSIECAARNGWRRPCCCFARCW
jgi:hypothetical protein